MQPAAIESFKKLDIPLNGKILDLGCGTGFVAEALKNKDNVFDGVDISENMLAIAREKNLYENLYKDDVLSFFNKHSAKEYNWILAFDVFCYLGNLEAILKALKGIKFCFSIESGDEMRGQDYYLAPNGRYKHKISYVSGLFNKLKIKDVQTKKIILRKENGNDVEGVLFYTL